MGVRKIAYITAMAPFAAGETFVLTELVALKELGTDILIVPRNISKGIFNGKAKALAGNTLSVALFDVRVIKEFLSYFILHPTSLLEILRDIAFNARSLKIAVKNLAVLPKGLYLSRVFQAKAIAHIHAHWASTTATMAYIISKVTGIPWSFTAHRWDIAENNILKQKCQTASFVRAISAQGKSEIIEIVRNKNLSEKIFLIHMGVRIPRKKTVLFEGTEIFVVLCPANFVEVKGHRYLFEACRILSERNVKFKCLVAGSGRLEEELRRYVSDLNLNGYVEFMGRLPQETLLDLYDKEKIHTVVLPSIVTDDGEKEGIPVSLVEAMAYGIPVISTETGGIPELIGDGSGIMVEEKNSEAIAEAIEKLMTDSAYYHSLSKRGREKIGKKYDECLISDHLLGLFIKNGTKRNREDRASGACSREI